MLVGLLGINCALGAIFTPGVERTKVPYSFFRVQRMSFSTG